MQTACFYQKIPEEISRQPMIFNNYKQYLPYKMEWLPEIGRLMEVSTMFDICSYCLFTLHGSTGLEVTLHNTIMSAPIWSYGHKYIHLFFILQS